jgi:hypothetical protein
MQAVLGKRHRIPGNRSCRCTSQMLHPPWHQVLRFLAVLEALFVAVEGQPDLFNGLVLL